MLDIGKLVDQGINVVFGNLLESINSAFAEILVNVMGTSIDVLSYAIVENGIQYAQLLAFTLLVLKVMNEALQTYILYQNGDSDADPSGLLIRTAQAVAIIATLPEIVKKVFEFGTQIALDVAALSGGGVDASTFAANALVLVRTGGLPIIILAIVALVMFLIIAIQAMIRGAELALMAVLGPIMALNLTANNRSMWSAWFKQLVIICSAQALQIFMIKGAYSLMVNLTNTGLLALLAWLWVTIKTPKFVQQFAYNTGFTGAVGGAGKQAGSMYLMRKMMTKGA